jgi:catechol 2,3-dioxygenase-like lactoylglutathione lyase family enzyme
MSYDVHISQITPIFVASDFEKTVNYYRGSLGFEKASETTSGHKFAVLNRDGFQLHIIEEIPGRNKPGHGRCVAVVNGLEKLYHEIKGYGGRLAEDLREIEPGKRVFVVADADDNRIAFAEDSSNLFMDLTELSSLGD